MTYVWFVAGSLFGGLLLGLALVAIATVGAVLPQPVVVAICLLCVAGVAEGAVRDRTPPSLARQVDHRWLDRYRGWVVGAGFGFQLGAGVFTRILSYGPYLLAICAFAGAPPTTLLATGVAYGAVRGLSAAPGGWVRSPSQLARLNQRVLRWETPSQTLSRVTDLIAIGAVVVALLLVTI